MIKAAFFDIDGTLVSFKTHAVPASTLRALEVLRERGIKTVISTGRSKSQLAAPLDSGFDAYITMNGQICFDSEGVFRCCAIDEDDVRTIVRQVQDGEYIALVLQEDRMFASGHSEDVRFIERHCGVTYEEGDIADALLRPTYQFCAYVHADREHILLDATKDVITTRWAEQFCDVVPREGGKDYGLRAACERFGISPEEAIAFGDGENDVSMLKAAGVGVAMGNAWDVVKGQADYVTDSVDEDGIWNACRHFGLI